MIKTSKKECDDKDNLRGKGGKSERKGEKRKLQSEGQICKQMANRWIKRIVLFIPFPSPPPL